MIHIDEHDAEDYISFMLDKLYQRDMFLIENDVTERAITHKMGNYLEEIVPKSFDVDCEYNRMGHMTFGKLEYTGGDYFAKTIGLSGEWIIDEDDKGSRVFPDIIVHKRGTAINLMVIEVKVEWKYNDPSHDYKKLQAYKEELRYQLTYFIELTKNRRKVRVELI